MVFRMRAVTEVLRQWPQDPRFCATLVINFVVLAFEPVVLDRQNTAHQKTCKSLKLKKLTFVLPLTTAVSDSPLPESLSPADGTAMAPSLGG